jgi:glycine/D-amino acid oxidase-like deaminating enzyme
VADFDNLYELGAATGRGVMQSYSLGLALAELITKGKFETLDASRLTGARFAMGQTEPENLDI